ncbi:hypothetical protein NE686_03330 [Tissierella carlieri]|uniref:Uncharacterized protein n=1 Tax=Tissierella carlieri TaxID=689904 RepID=A0ABT1S6M1_9FIRM|nr:hypothetical protein [Tissierella carlieri]MCQ4922106.1 hypothetical protein [Tissierella carlieri]
MRGKFKLIWDKLKIILKDKSGEGNIEKVKNILFTPPGYKFLKNNIEKYSVQIGMLNQLLKEELISEKEHSSIRNSIRRKYEIKE